MVFLVLSRAGYDELTAQPSSMPSALWVNDGVLSASELLEIREAGVKVTNFTRSIDPHDMSAIEQAISTVQEHHAGQRVWVEWTKPSI
jgi:hypothetical protein